MTAWCIWLGPTTKRGHASAHPLITGANGFIYGTDFDGIGCSSEEHYTSYLSNTRMDLKMVEACVTVGVSRMFFSTSACVYPTHLQEKEAETPLLSEDQLLPANAD